MSTRANIVIRDDCGSELWFYRHSDGYPTGALPTLRKFCKWVDEGRIRANACQSAGWLILLGHHEYADANLNVSFPPTNEPNSVYGWKVGAYEPTEGLHEDVEYLYEIMLIDSLSHGEAELTVRAVKGWENQELSKAIKVGKQKDETIEKALCKLFNDDNAEMEGPAKDILESIKKSLEAEVAKMTPDMIV